jgi:predicted PurR-regulated permease PerM
VLITAKANFLSASGDTILLLIIGVDFAFLWGVLSFFLGFIPSIGFLLSLIPPMILAFLEFGWQAALAVLLGYWIINGIADNVIKPKFVGVGLNLSPMVVFLALVIWGWPLGLMGALLSIPLTMIVYRSILQPLDSTRWLANMMRYGVDDQSESDAISAAASETPS